MPRGRKSKLNAKMIQELARHIKAGNFAMVACEYMNIGKSAYYDWLATGRKDKENGISSLYSELVDAIKSAEAEAEMRNVNIIQNAALNTWQAAAWYLERKHNDRWGVPKQKLEITGKDESPLNVEMRLNNLGSQELKEIERILRNGEESDASNGGKVSGPE